MSSDSLPAVANETHRVRILVIVPYYLPGYKGGGPIRSVAGLVSHLGDEFTFDILTSDRDFGDTEPYPDLPSGVWHPVGKARVRYLQPVEKRLWSWRRLLMNLDYDLIYLNSFFSPLTIRTLFWRRMGVLPRRPVILAPRGQFSPGALNLKPLKKRFYLWLAKQVGLYNDLLWQASSEYEQRDILRVMGETPLPDERATALRVCIAPNLAPYEEDFSSPSRLDKVPGTIRLIFLSRIARKKNLDGVLRLLSTVKGEVFLDIYGPIEDEAYWQECRDLIRVLPPNVAVEYRGSVKPQEVSATFSQYHLFFFPTHGENFGHVILESLRAGCPVLISDQTPWRHLEEQGVGWDLPLDKPDLFLEVLERCLAMDEVEYREWSERARLYGRQKALDPYSVEANRRLFMRALKA
jgi:glycosyltransferase involved in cell wall biosynthesis